MSVSDRWHLARPPADAKTCGKHRGKVASAEHEIGLRWQVRGTDGDGMPVKRNFEYEGDAKDFDAELKAQVRAGTYVDDRAGRVTFAVYAEEWRRHRTHDPETARRIRSEFANHVYADGGNARGRTAKGGVALGDHELGVLSRRPTLIQEWIKSMPVSANTKLLIIRDVNQVFRAAIADGKIAKNPLRASLIQKPKPDKSLAVAWSREQVDAVAGALPEYLAPMAYLGAACGHRQGELFAVQVDDLILLRRMCRVEVQLKQVGGQFVFAATKNRAVRDVPIPAQVVPVLSEHLRLFPAVPVTLPWLRSDGSPGKPVTRRLAFTHPDGVPWNRGTANPPWRRAWRAAGIPEADQINGMHVLRHTAASVWLSKGLSLAKVASYLGDTQAVILSTYSHFMPSDDDRARAIMEEFFTAPAEGSDALTIPWGASE